MSVSAPLQPLRIEQIVTYLRVFGLVVGVPTIALAEFPGPDRPVLAWGIQLVLLLGTVAIAVWLRNLRRGDDHLLLYAGFLLDCLVIAGYVLAFSHLEPNVSWAMIFTLVADAALRFGVRGAVLGWVLAAVLFAVQAQAHEGATGHVMPPVGYLYVLGTLGGAAGILAVFSLTLGRQALLAQQQALALADANRVRDRLLAMSSHEFRGSLAAMRMAAETVRANLDRLSPDRAVALLAEVDRQGTHLTRLVDDLFTVARARSGDIEVRARWDDLAESVQVALAAASRHRDGHVLTVSVEPVSCHLDHERFQQVLRNLVENAYKYSPPGSRVVVVAAHYDDHIELRVADDGPGIPAADREQVFEPFARRRGAASRSDSSGLGLYVVQQIVAAMGGSLDLHTAASGTEFVVSLPAESGPVGLRAVPGPSDSQPDPHNGGSGSTRPAAWDAARRR